MQNMFSSNTLQCTLATYNRLNVHSRYTLSCFVSKEMETDNSDDQIVKYPLSLPRSSILFTHISWQSCNVLHNDDLYLALYLQVISCYCPCRSDGTVNS